MKVEGLLPSASDDKSELGSTFCLADVKRDSCEEWGQAPKRPDPQIGSLKDWIYLFFKFKSAEKRIFSINREMPVAAVSI